MKQHNNNFVVISTQRSGSTLLINLLDQHPELTCAGEIFKQQTVQQILHPEFTFDLEKKRKNWLFGLTKNSQIKKHLRRIMSTSEEGIGFKLMISQIETLPDLPKILKELNFKIIVLRRPDLILQSLSLALAQATGKWTNVKGEGKSGMVEIDIPKLEKTVRFFTNSDSELSELGADHNVFEIHYDQLQEVLSGTLKDIFSYLHVDEDFSPDVNIKKTSEKQYAERISNYEEVKQFFLDKGLKDMPE